jgi:hypothetical protein
MNNINDISNTIIIPHKPSQVEIEKINIQKQIEISDISIINDLFSEVQKVQNTNIIQENKSRKIIKIIKSSKNNNNNSNEK